MFSIFPADWEAPKPKDNDDFIPKEQEKVSKSMKSNNDAQNGAHNVQACNCPASEMLRPEEEIDISDIDEMLIKMGMTEDIMPSNNETTYTPSETTHEKILRMVDNVNVQLKNHIKALKEGSFYNENISNKALMELLENFKNYNEVMGQYLKKQSKHIGGTK